MKGGEEMSDGGRRTKRERWRVLMKERFNKGRKGEWRKERKEEERSMTKIE